MTDYYTCKACGGNPVYGTGAQACKCKDAWPNYAKQMSEPQPRPEEFAKEFAKVVEAGEAKKEWAAPVVTERRVNLAEQQLQGFYKALPKGEAPRGSGLRQDGFKVGVKPQTGDHLKKDAGKPPIGLIPRSAVEAEAAVLAFGAKKYATHGWREGMAWSRVLDAAMRHLHAYNDGEDRDPETGLLHLAHVKCCMSFLIEYATHGIGKDDRFKRDQ